MSIQQRLEYEHLLCRLRKEANIPVPDSIRIKMMGAGALLYEINELLTRFNCIPFTHKEIRKLSE